MALVPLQTLTPGRLQRIPLGGKPWANAYYSVGREICDNLYIEASNTPEAVSDYFAVMIPGLRSFSPSTADGGCSGMFLSATERCFGVFAGYFCEVLDTGLTIQRGLVGANARATSFAEIVNANGNHLIMFVNGAGGWTFEVESNTFAAITDEDFPGNNGNLYPTSVKAIDTYFLVNVPGTNTYRWSEPKYIIYVDGAYSTHWNPINVQEMFTSASNVVSMEALNGQLWLFSERGVEIHYDTGDYLNGVWQRYQGAILNIGTSAPSSVTKYGNQAFWIGSDASGTVGVFTNDGFNPKKVSTRGIDQILNDIGETNDAISFVIAEAGHIWVVFQFPTADRTFVYDPVVDAWHERSYMDPEGGRKSRWRGTFATEAFGKNLVGDRDTNAVYWSDFHAYRNDSPDGTTPNYIRWEKTLPPFFQNGQLVRIRELQVMLQQGVGLSNDAFGQEPFLSIAVAFDSGMQYGAERQIPMGRQGEYKMRSRGLSFGCGRYPVVRLSGAAPVQTIIVGMLANVEVSNR